MRLSAAFPLPLLIASGAFAQPFVHEVAIDPGKESSQQILEKAASVVPSPRQLAYLDLGFTCFVHFGINTYTGAEWGSGKESPAVFNPGETFDPDQWVRTAKDAGMKMMMITVKHHDGFCLWQTRYNDTFSVRGIPWRGGKGDVLRALADACRTHGLKLGVYLSPADLYQMESAKGLYGNGSKPVPTTIPTDVASFSSDPTRVRADKPAAAPVFQVDADDYNRYFMNQLYELLTEYGQISEVWFDGAHPKQKGGQTYIKDEWFKLIRTLAPQAVIFGGPDVRWCGNEAGRTRANEWSVIPVADELLSGEDRTKDDLGSDADLAARSYDVYGKKREPKFLYHIISETDTSIRNGWFWRNETEQGVRTADDVFDIYERTTGGNGVFLLNVPPDNRGLFAPRDVATLQETGRRIRATYGTRERMDGATSDHPEVIDGNPACAWQSPSKAAEITLSFPSPRQINRVVLMEDIAKVGQRVSSHTVEARIDGKWQEVAKAGVIGYRRILRFPSVTTDAVRVRILDARLAPAISEVSVAFYQAPPPALKVTRDPQGLVTLTPAAAAAFKWKPHGQADPTDKAFTIHYTTDGTAPDASSPVYAKPIALPEGGMLKAVAIVGTQAGAVLETRIPLPRQDLKMVSVSSEHSGYEAAKAIDGDPATFWHSDWSQSPPHPHTLVIDTGKLQTLSGFTYLPRQDKSIADGMIETGEVSTSTNGETWTAAEPFRFGNLVNDPSERTQLFEKPIQARYFRLVSKSGAAGKPYAAAAEIGLLGK